MWRIRLDRDIASSLYLGFSLPVCLKSAQQPPVLIPLFVSMFCLVCPVSCSQKGTGSFVVCWSLVLEMVSCLLFGGIWCWRWSHVCCLVESGVGDGLMFVVRWSLVLDMVSCLLFGGVWCWRWSHVCCLVESGVGDGLMFVVWRNLVLELVSCLLFGGVWCWRWSHVCCLVESGVGDGLVFVV